MRWLGRAGHRARTDARAQDQSALCLRQGLPAQNNAVIQHESCGFYPPDLSGWCTSCPDPWLPNHCQHLLTGLPHPLPLSLGPTLQGPLQMLMNSCPSPAQNSRRARVLAGPARSGFWLSLSFPCRCSFLPSHLRAFAQLSGCWEYSSTSSSPGEFLPFRTR